MTPMKCPVPLPRHQCRWNLTVGVLTCGASGCPVVHRTGPVECRLSGAPTVRALTLARTVAHLMRLQSTVACEVVVAPLAHRQSGVTPDTVRCFTGQSGELYRSDLPFSRRWQVQRRVPWCTEHCPMAHRTVWCTRPGCHLGCL